MWGKFFLFALIGISLVQATAEEDFVKDGLQTVDNLKKYLNERMNDVNKAVDENKNLMENMHIVHYTKSEGMGNSYKHKLQNTTKHVIRRAKEKKYDENVLKCVNSVSRRLIDENYKSYKSFQEGSMYSVITMTMPNIDSVSQSLGKLSTQSTMTYLSAIKQIKQCKDKPCVSNAVKQYTTFVEETALADIQALAKKNTNAYEWYDGNLEYVYSLLQFVLDVHLSISEFEMKRCFPEEENEEEEDRK